jgi:hypothetical protein
MWVDCKECVYFENCNEKETRDGCYFGMAEKEAEEEFLRFMENHNK